ncbi:MAG: sialate O-acetylesterase [Phycisphaerales bacterium]|jgi:sialate O-acetylesterase
MHTALLSALALSSALAVAEPPRLNSLFSDHMVLQRDTDCRVWGTASPMANVTVEIAGHAVIATADADGHWIATLPASPAGGPHTLTVSSTSTHGDGIPEAVTFTDVLFGDVWIASGQSNMQWSLNNTDHAERFIADSADDQLRLLSFERRLNKAPQTEPFTNAWSAASPETTPGFSAVAYHFGAMLRSELSADGTQVPIGLIHSSWGGTLAEAWTPVEALEAGGFTAITDRIAIHDAPVDSANLDKEVRAYNDFFDTLLADQSIAEDADWQAATVPGFWQTNHANFDGLIVYQRTVTLNDWPDEDTTLNLGPIDDFEATYINGKLVGKTAHETPGYWSHPREYTVPAGVLHTGENTITVYAIDTGGAGGFFASPDDITLTSGDLSIPLAGDMWHAAIIGSTRDLKFPSYPANNAANSNTRPACLYNAMIHPMKDLAITGAIWYQGESNAGRAEQYQTLFPTMIESWRDAFNNPDMPFYFVQLANFMQRADEPQESAWAELREAQTMALDLPNTGMATIIDIGKANDIHPRNKHDVGHRLARNALFDYYGKDVVPTGPVLRGEPGLQTVNTIETRPGKRSYPILIQEAVLEFEFADGLRTTDGEAPRGFEVCAPGKDKPFVKAEARIEDGNVILSVKNLPGIESVRYAWADNPDVNLVNGEGLPAQPFRTDDRPGTTAGRE